MSKKNRTVTIEQILADFDEEEKKEIVSTYEYCMNTICAEKLNWLKFQVFLPGKELMRMMLEAKTPEFLMAIADEILSEQIKANSIKIVAKRAKKESVDIFSYNGNVIATISISKKMLRKLVTEEG